MRIDHGFVSEATVSQLHSRDCVKEWSTQDPLYIGPGLESYTQLAGKGRDNLHSETFQFIYVVLTSGITVLPNDMEGYGGYTIL